MSSHRTEPEALTAYLSLSDADHLLTSSGIRTPAVRVVRDGTVLPESSYTQRATLAGQPVTGLVDARRLLALFDEGATLVLQGLQRYWPPLTDLVSRLETELGHPCQANAYLTPPGAQGFAVHADSHDVFVFQTAGRKHWQIHTESGVEDLLLEPGLVVYLPTGTRHAARAQDGISLHVTIGVNQLTLRSLVRRAVLAELDAVPDRHLPAGYLDHPTSVSRDVAAELEALAARIRDIDATQAVAAEGRRALSTRPSRLVGGLLDRDGLAGLADDTVLLRRPGHPCVLCPKGDRLEVLLGDRVLDVPGRLRPALDRICAADRLAVRDLSTLLDPPSGLVLCRRLVREGLLRIAP